MRIINISEFTITCSTLTDLDLIACMAKVITQLSQVSAIEEHQLSRNHMQWCIQR